MNVDKPRRNDLVGNGDLSSRCRRLPCRKQRHAALTDTHISMEGLVARPINNESAAKYDVVHHVAVRFCCLCAQFIVRLRGRLVSLLQITARPGL